MEKTIKLRSPEALVNEKKILLNTHPELFEIQVNLDGDDEDAVCNIFVKYPNRNEFEQLIALWNLSKINAFEFLVKTCWVGGDPLEIIVSNDYALRSLEFVLLEMLYISPSSVVKEKSEKKEELLKGFSNVFEIRVKTSREDDTKESTVFVKYPTRAEYNRIMELYEKSVIAGVEFWFDTQWIGGDNKEDILKNDYALRSLDYAMANVLYVRQSVLKKKLISLSKLIFTADIIPDEFTNSAGDFRSYCKHVESWRDFFRFERASYFKYTAILRHNYPLLDVDNIDDDKFITVLAEYLWIREDNAKIAK